MEDTSVNPDVDMSPWAIKANFLTMSVFFSMIMGTFMSMVAIAGAVHGTQIGLNENGFMYGMYSASSLLFAGGFVQVSGSKLGLFVAGTFASVYVASFVLADIAEPIMEPILYIGALVSGLGTGTIWTAQGAYFSETCQVYAAALGKKPGEVTAELAGQFAMISMAGEMIMKLLVTQLYAYLSKIYVYVVVVIVTAVGVFGLLTVRNIAEDQRKLTGKAPQPMPPVCSRAFWAPMFRVDRIAGAINMVMYDPKMAFLMLGPAAFGTTTTMVVAYFNSKIIPDDFGTGDVDYFAAALTAGAAIFSQVFAVLAKYTGKYPIYVFGQWLFITINIICLVVPEREWDSVAGLIIINFMQGIGRATFISTTRAIFADIWFKDEERPFAFANLILGKGIGTTSANFIMAHISQMSRCLWGLYLALFAIIGVFVAMNTKEENTNKSDEPVPDH